MAATARHLYLVDDTGGPNQAADDYSNIDRIGDLYRPIITHIDNFTSDSVFSVGYPSSVTGSALSIGAPSDMRTWGAVPRAKGGALMDLATFEAFQEEMRTSIAAIAGRLSTMEVSVSQPESREAAASDNDSNNLDVDRTLAVVKAPVEGEDWAKLLDRIADQGDYSHEAVQYALEGLVAKNVAVRCAAARVIALGPRDEAMTILSEHLDKEASSVAKSVISSVIAAVAL